MKKLYFSFVTILIVAMIFSTSVLGTVDTELPSKSEVNMDIETQEEKLQKEDTIKLINECLEELRVKLAQIDNKIQELKLKPEYKTYPGIRLNIDTPLFGMISVIDSKLKISTDISTADFASGYSIKSIVKNKVIKLPSFSVGSIVVITRDVTLDDSITLADANTAVLKLMQYIDQVESVKRFLDEQINNIFYGYIPADKSNKIKEINNRLDVVFNSMLEEDENIVYLHLFATQNEAYDEYLNRYNKIIDSIYDLRQNAANVLISDVELSKLDNSVTELENEVLNLGKEVNKRLDIAKENINLEMILNSLKEELTIKQQTVQKYIDDANKIETQQGEQTAENKVKLYDVTSIEILEYMNNALNNIDEKIKKYVPAKIDNTLPPEVISKGEVNSIVILSDEEKIVLANELKMIYDEFISKENKFYLDNLNFLIKDTSTKISDIGKYTNENVLQNMKYVYLELPNTLREFLRTNSLRSNIETVNLTVKVKNELEKLVQTNINVNKVYKQNTAENKDGMTSGM